MFLKVMGGYTDKPFNCCNFLFDYYCENRKRLYELSDLLSGIHFNNEIKKRLKNILYFINITNKKDRRDDEAFYFALLCCAAPNKDIRCLAMKLLYDITYNNNDYIELVIEEYRRISDFYIKEAAIYVLSQMNKKNSKITTFFNQIIIEDDNLTAKSIYRVSLYLEKTMGYIHWNRKNLFRYNKKAAISDYICSILDIVDIYNKNYFEFRYWSKDRIDMYSRFIMNKKAEVEKNIDNKDIKIMDIESFFESFEDVFKYVFRCYNVSVEECSGFIDENDFANSTYMKCVDISNGLYYGSLMCNYYRVRYAIFRTNDDLCYEVYNPLEYGESIVITAPIPLYQDFIEKLGDNVINFLEIPEQKDFEWASDADLTRKNIMSFLKDIKLKKENWTMLAGRVYLMEEEKYTIIWNDTYSFFCCSSESETIYPNSDARYLTIELEEYTGNLNTYIDNKEKPWLCKRVRNIYGESDVLDETSLVLPPSNIIKFLDLKFNASEMSWDTEKGEKVIVCNNNKNSYYKDPIGGTVFIRKKYLEKFLEKNTIKYFAFAERRTQETGYLDETSLHFEIKDGEIKKEIKNQNYSQNIQGWN